MPQIPPSATPPGRPAVVSSSSLEAALQPSRLQPGTVEDSRDTIAHQRAPRHNRIYGATKWGLSTLVVGAACGGWPALLAPAAAAYGGLSRRGSLRPPQPASVRKDIFFHKGIVGRWEDSAQLVADLKRGGVLGRRRPAWQTGRARHVLRLEALTPTLTPRLNVAQRQHVHAVLADIQAEERRVTMLTAQARATDRAVVRLGAKALWARPHGFAGAIETPPGGGRPGPAEQRLDAARQMARSLRRALGALPARPAYVPAPAPAPSSGPAEVMQPAIAEAATVAGDAR